MVSAVAAVSPRRLALLRTQQADYIWKIRARGGRVLKLKAPCCGAEIDSHVPNRKGEQWDSLTTCTGCGGLFMSVLTNDAARGFIPEAAR